jgi:hypothetical protein
MVSTPEGILWITMEDGYASCNDGRDEITVAPHTGALTYYYGDEEMLIVFKTRRIARHHDGIGITAPREWAILREELIDKPAGSM